MPVSIDIVFWKTRRTIFGLGKEEEDSISRRTQGGHKFLLFKKNHTFLCTRFEATAVCFSGKYSLYFMYIDRAYIHWHPWADAKMALIRWLCSSRRKFCWLNLPTSVYFFFEESEAKTFSLRWENGQLGSRKKNHIACGIQIRAPLDRRHISINYRINE